MNELEAKATEKAVFVVRCLVDDDSVRPWLPGERETWVTATEALLGKIGKNGRNLNKCRFLPGEALMIVTALEIAHVLYSSATMTKDKRPRDRYEFLKHVRLALTLFRRLVEPCLAKR